jgi:hypothetical protein
MERAEAVMDEINGEESFMTEIECPACRAAGLTTDSGYIPRLVYMPGLVPHYRCVGIHGGISDAMVQAVRIDTEVDEESRERWEDESPSATVNRQS